MLEDTAPFIRPTRVKREITIQEINDPPMPNSFDVTKVYPSDGLPEWFAPLKDVLEDQTVDSLEIVLGGGKVRYKITASPVERKGLFG